MEVKQVYDLVNTMTKETIGESVIVNEDLSNVVDVGKEIINQGMLDNYIKKLPDHIGKMVFSDRKYSVTTPSVLMDGWEFGSILQKVRSEMPEATVNEDWQLQDGSSYDPNVFYAPKAVNKFFNGRVCFEIDRSYTEQQIKESFTNASQLNGFFSMLYNDVDKAMTIKLDDLIMRTINNMISETIHDDYGSASVASASHVKAVNLLKLYNTSSGETLTVNNCLLSGDFLRFAAGVMRNYVSRLTRASTLFNVGKTVKFTPRDLLHVVMLGDFYTAAETHLYGPTYNEEYEKFPVAELVPYWQGSGDNFAFDNISKIDIKNAFGHTVSQTGILGVMFDRDCLGVSNVDRRVRTHVNEKADFVNYFHKYFAGYFNDANENCVCFLIA